MILFLKSYINFNNFQYFWYLGAKVKQIWLEQDVLIRTSPLRSLSNEYFIMDVFLIFALKE
jgi:hypothetical protein